MFTLAHLSDPHLAPLPAPQWKELLGKRLTGYINWQKKRRFIHDAEKLAAIVADIKAQKPDHIAVTGDIANIALATEFRQCRDWLEDLGPAKNVSLVPGNHDIYVSEAAAFAARQWGTYMIFASSKVSDEVVYKVIEALENNKAELVAIQPALREFSAEALYKNYDIPYHPGALKYFKDKNITAKSLN